ncbi:ribonuclease HI [Aurantimonas sp. VKM B-3413]|nr:ribonuclease HI [Aurantimonas sp. VKM B-3413]MCB8840041.1 ribonuclease HI [Aurantimonas sp. VKM B-3413]
MTSTSIERPRTVVHTDGACVGNPGPGGWAAVIHVPGDNRATSQTRTVSGGHPDTTNNRMEMAAVIGALRALPKGTLRIVSDSQYVIKGITEWLRPWKSRGWRNAEGKAVKNRDLWEELDHLTAGRDIEWKWTKGHAGTPENEEADRLANAEAMAWAARAVA